MAVRLGKRQLPSHGHPEDGVTVAPRPRFNHNLPDRLETHPTGYSRRLCRWRCVMIRSRAGLGLPSARSTPANGN